MLASMRSVHGRRQSKPRHRSIPALLVKTVLGMSPRRGLRWAGGNGGGDDEAGDGAEEGFCQAGIPQDAYGAAVVAMVRDVPRLTSKDKAVDRQLAIWNCLFAFIVLAVNLVLQSFMLAYIYLYVVGSDVRQVQKLYKEFRQSMYTSSGEFLQDKWVLYEDRQDLCQITLWNRPFYYSILTCWNLVMLIEIRNTEEFIRDILRVPLVEDPKDMVKKAGDQEHCVGLTWWTKVMVVGCTALPRLCTAIVLLWIGCEWLSATSQFEDLVMNTVAMNFIVEIDNLLFEGLLPRHQRKDVANISFLCKETEFEATSGELLKTRAVYRKSLLYLCCLGIFVVTYAEWIQDVVPPDIHTIRDMCQKLLTKDLQPSCVGQTLYLQGMPSSRECFPVSNETPGR
mmetsp:Transcript_92379/g.298557  ORF Transcript_92379/g.298557 Transcript_92379/m.298557 type:complete len:396 (-) Transcript_92379:244-1431(-)